MSPLPFPALRAFVEVARRGSMKEAAATLGVTAGAVSQQVKLLERFLGTALFERGHRSVRLSAEGRRLFPELDAGFQSIEAAMRPFFAHAGRADLLTVSTTPSFAATWLAARLGRFHRDHPGIELRLLTSAARADLLAGEADAAIRHSIEVEPGLAATVLLAPKLVAVASPQLGGLIALREPADCLGQTLLQDRDRADWALWLAGNGVAPDGRARLGSSFADDALLVRAAVAGQGLAVVRDLYAADELAAGRLVLCPGEPIPTGARYRLVERPDRARRPANAAFRAFLVAAAAAEGGDA